MDKKTEITNVDDQASFRRAFTLTCKLLRLKNFELFEKSEDLLEWVNSQQPEVKLMFVDWNLKTSKGKVHGELIRQLRQDVPTARIYVLSTSENAEEMAEAKAAGADGWVSKNNLRDTLKLFMEQYESVSEFRLWKG